MQIVPVQVFNLEATIDSVYRDWSAKQQLLALSQTESEQKASEVLLNQFQNQLSDVLQFEIQNCLQLKFVIDLQNSSEAFGEFNYLGVTVRIYRQMVNKEVFWQIKHQEQSITCFPDVLQKQLLIELGRIKSASTPV